MLSTIFDNFIFLKTPGQLLHGNSFGAIYPGQLLRGNFSGATPLGQLLRGQLLRGQLLRGNLSWVTSPGPLLWAHTAGSDFTQKVRLFCSTQGTIVYHKCVLCKMPSVFLEVYKNSVTHRDKSTNSLYVGAIICHKN